MVKFLVIQCTPAAPEKAIFVKNATNWMTLFSYKKAYEKYFRPSFGKPEPKHSSFFLSSFSYVIHIYPIETQRLLLFLVKRHRFEIFNFFFSKNCKNYVKNLTHSKNRFFNSNHILCENFRKIGEKNITTVLSKQLPK